MPVDNYALHVNVHVNFNTFLKIVFSENTIFSGKITSNLPKFYRENEYAGQI